MSERVLHAGHTVTMVEGVYEAPDGTRFERDVVRHPGAVSVVALTDAGEVVLVRQYRAALDRDLLEVPAGKRDVLGEDPALTAHRELAEEVGLQAARMELLAEFHNSPGFTDEHSFSYLARGLTACATDFQGVEEHHMTVERVALGDVPAMIADGRITDAKTIIGVLLAKERLRAERAEQP